MLINVASEFLVHAADVEGLCQGIDEDLVRSTSATPPLSPLLTSCVAELGEWAKIPTTYAGGARGTQTQLYCMASSNTVSRYFRSRPC